MPEFEGRVNCIYIDPPYNTGNEGWVYNDNVNDPRILKWLGDVVGKEGEDLTRHDKWLCMMYPRLKLLHRLLADDGVIFISIDDNEQANLKLICDEIFGVKNFVASIAWEKRYTRSNNAKMFYSLKDFIFVYRKSGKLETIKEGRTAKADLNYSNPDNDPRGNWTTSSYVNPATKEKRKNLVYTILAPEERLVNHPTHAWKYSKEEHERHKIENLLWWGANGKALYPRLKIFASNAPEMVPVDLWDYQTTGTTDEGGQELKDIFGSMNFDTPKPTKLLERIISLVTKKDSIILDSFAGSGTTAHAVLKLNAQDGGNRQFILCEMMDYADTITAERVRRVMAGYGEGNKRVEGLGGSFGYYELGEPLFHGEYLNEAVGVEKIRQYIAYSENIPLAQRTEQSSVSQYLMGISEDTAWILFYETQRETVLDVDFLATLKYRANGYAVPAHSIIYADRCVLSLEQLEHYGIRFKKIPRDLSRL